MARVEERGSELNRLTISRANIPSAIKGRGGGERVRIDRATSLLLR